MSTEIILYCHRQWQLEIECDRMCSVCVCARVDDAISIGLCQIQAYECNHVHVRSVQNAQHWRWEIKKSKTMIILLQYSSACSKLARDLYLIPLGWCVHCTLYSFNDIKPFPRLYWFSIITRNNWLFVDFLV